MHTTDSDGTASIRDMALAGIACGREYVAITDHSKGLAIANGMHEDELEHQGETIRGLNDELGGDRPFRILRAVEMNLSPSGTGDLDREFLYSLELVLGAFTRDFV